MRFVSYFFISATLLIPFLAQAFMGFNSSAIGKTAGVRQQSEFYPTDGVFGDGAGSDMYGKSVAVSGTVASQVIGDKFVSHIR